MSLPPRQSGGLDAFPETSDYDYLLKIILVGDSGVGKSCLLKSYMTSKYDEAYTSTIGVDFEIKHVIINDKKVNLQIWDTAGQERFRTITTSYYRVADVVILVFDTTDSQTFGNLKNWLEDVKAYAQEGVDIMMVGNKVDLEDKRQVDFTLASHFASQQGISYMETSAKNGINVENVFTTIAQTALTHKISKQKRNAKEPQAVGINPTQPANDICNSC